VRKLLRSRRGITPVLSSLLMTVIAVAGMSIAITATYVITDGLHDNMGERLIVEDVGFTSAGQISLYIRNVGKVSVNVDAVYVNRTSRAFSALELEPGEHGWLNVTYSWSPDSTYEIKVVTRGGTNVVDYYMSPS
jgi:archaellum component FlaG (FlaF/FlaG flagellin family)